jgi:hypothetical protein
MDRSRKANRADNEVTLQHKSRREALLVAELIEEKLKQLEASIRERRQSPGGTAELRRRVKAFGECRRSEGESTARYFDKLRRWFNRPIPHTKSPLHPPRQNGR